MENSQESNKKIMSEEERLQLAAKLDRELDDFINSLEKKRYSEGWPEDRWQEEMDKHPFFMKKPPEPGEEVHPMIEGLQQLKYDEEENTPEELALKYKEDGNYYLKYKKYRMAILSYTEGINNKHENQELLSTLYNNRSAANFFIQNYRSSLNDAQKSIELKGDYAKPKIRVIKCFLELKKYEDALKHLELYLIEDPCNKDLIDLQKQAITLKAQKARDDRKSANVEKKKQQEFEKTVKSLIDRGVKFEELKDLSGDKLKVKLTPEFLKPKLEPLEFFPVKLNEDDLLNWPVMFCYPEYQVTEFYQKLNEESSIYECLSEMLAQPMDCDKERKYTNVDELTVYYENRISAKVFRVDYKKPLKDILKEDYFYVQSGYLTFYVVPKNTTAEMKFIHQSRQSIVS